MFDKDESHFESLSHTHIYVQVYEKEMRSVHFDKNNSCMVNQGQTVTNPVSLTIALVTFIFFWHPKHSSSKVHSSCFSMAGGFNIPDELENMMGAGLFRLSLFERKGWAGVRSALLVVHPGIVGVAGEGTAESGQLFRLLVFMREGEGVRFFPLELFEKRGEDTLKMQSTLLRPLGLDGSIWRRILCRLMHLKLCNPCMVFFSVSSPTSCMYHTHICIHIKAIYDQYYVYKLVNLVCMQCN